MKSIVKVVDKLGRARRLEVVRKVNIDDFLTGEDYIQPEEYDPDKCSTVTCSTAMKIRPEVITHLLKKLKLETFDGRSGVTYRKRWALGKLTHEWNPEYGSTFWATTKRKISYRGLRKDGLQREKKWASTWESVTNNWKNHRDSFIQDQLDSVDEVIANLVNECNERFGEELLDFVQNINVKREWLEAKRDATADGIVLELHNIGVELQILKERRAELDLKLAQCDRENVLRYLLDDDKSNLSDESKERVTAIAAECMDKLPTSRSRRFG